MKKTLRFVGMALVAFALCFGVTSCGDDDVPVPDVDKTANGNNGVVDFRDGSDNPVPYPTHFSLAEGKYIELSVCDVNAKEGEKLSYLDDGSWSIDYDSDYFMIRLASNYSDADNGTFLFIRALKTTNGKELPITLNYSFKGQKCKTVFYVTVTTQSEDAKEGFIKIGSKEVEIKYVVCNLHTHGLDFLIRGVNGEYFDIYAEQVEPDVEYGLSAKVSEEDIAESPTCYFSCSDLPIDLGTHPYAAESCPESGTFKYMSYGNDKYGIRLYFVYDGMQCSVVWDGQVVDMDDV